MCTIFHPLNLCFVEFMFEKGIVVDGCVPTSWTSRGAASHVPDELKLRCLFDVIGAHHGLRHPYAAQMEDAHTPLHLVDGRVPPAGHSIDSMPAFVTHLGELTDP